MLHEFAVDPECLTEWASFQIFMQEFGIEKGRILSMFPKKWPKMVRECCKDLSFQQTKKMGQYFAWAKQHAFVKSGRPYDGDKEWSDNAISQHSDVPFHAVITNATSSDISSVFSFADADRFNEYWQVPTDKSILRDDIEIYKTILPLLNISSQVKLIDNYFIEQNDAEIFKNSLKNILTAAMPQEEDSPLDPPSFEYHKLIKEYKKDTIFNDKKLIDNFFEKKIASIVPTGMNFKLCLWVKKENSSGMHARMVLTNRGGIEFDWGLAPATGEHKGEKTHVKLLSEKLTREEWNKYCVPSDDFDLWYSKEIIG